MRGEISKCGNRYVNTISSVGKCVRHHIHFWLSLCWRSPPCPHITLLMSNEGSLTLSNISQMAALG